MGQHFGAAERRRNALRRHRVLLHAGVADQRPAGAGRPAHEAPRATGVEPVHPRGAGHHLAQVGRDLLQPRVIGRFAVAAGVEELVIHQIGGDQHRPVAGWEGEGARPLSDVETDVVEGDSVPVGPDVALDDRFAVRFPRSGAAGDDGGRAVRADHDARAFFEGPSASACHRDACHPAVALDQIDRPRPLAEFGAGGGRRFGEGAVEEPPSRAVGGPVALHRRRRAFQHDAVHVDTPVGEGRGARLERRQHSPGAQAGDAERMDQMGGLPHLAGEAVAINQQHAVTLARQQHRGRRARATGADDDRVVDGAPPRSVPRPVWRAGGGGAMFASRTIRRGATGLQAGWHRSLGAKGRRRRQNPSEGRSRGQGHALRTVGSVSV